MQTELQNILHMHNLEHLYVKILDHDKLFYSKFLNEIKLKNILHGGHIIEYKFKDNIYKIKMTDSESTITFALKTNDNKNNCILIIIPKNDKYSYAYIQDIQSLDDCPYLGHIKNGRGAEIFKLALNFIHSIAHKYKLKYIQLKDTSRLYCKQINKYIDLSSIYMISKGHTWYGKYGFVPFDTEKYKVDIDKLVAYKVNQSLVDVIPINCTNIFKLLENEVDKNNMSAKTYKKIKSLADNNINVKTFFLQFLKNYDNNCKIFAIIYKDFMKQINLENLYGISYVLKIDNDFY